jgi:hypothetical protein
LLTVHEDIIFVKKTNLCVGILVSNLYTNFEHCRISRESMAMLFSYWLNVSDDGLNETSRKPDMTRTKNIFYRDNTVFP